MSCRVVEYADVRGRISLRKDQADEYAGFPRIGFDSDAAGRGHGPDHGAFSLMLSRLTTWLSLVPWGRGLLSVLVILFVLVRVGEAQGSAPGWVRHYGDDLLCIPLVLSFILTVHRLVAGDGRILPAGHGLLALGAFTVGFELILPVFTPRAVGDPVDGLMYLAGFVIFQLFLNRGVAVHCDRADIPGTFLPFDSPTRPIRRNHGYL